MIHPITFTPYGSRVQGSGFGLRGLGFKGFGFNVLGLRV